jgi:hypothetical protein
MVEWLEGDWRRAGRCFAVVLCCVGGAGMYAQQQQAASGGAAVGSVTGHVIAQDTQKAARFAQVMLQGVTAAADSNEERREETVNSQTDADGNFLAVNVAPGDYYVTATAPGYIPERALLQAGVIAGTSPAALLAQIPVVHVAAYSTASVVVTMERGATISGRVQWEDGSPAAGLGVRAVSTAGGNGTLPSALQNISPGALPNMGSTDDRGAFRISGLVAGEYLVQTQIQPPAQFGGVGTVARFNSATTIYSPGVYRKPEAKAVTVNGGEERSDVRLVIDLHGLHTVSGHVASSDPSQNVASGRVTVVDPNDASMRLMTLIVPSGDFVLRYVPAGTYTLQVSGASTQADGGRRGNQAANASFQQGTQALTVGDTDITDVAISLTPVQGSQ